MADPLEITIPKGIVILIEGELTGPYSEMTHLIVWPEAGIVIPWPPEITAEEAFTAWANRRKFYGPLSPVKFPSGASILIYVDDDVKRTDAKEAYLIYWEAIEVAVPWPEGFTVREAMDAWIAKNRY